MPPSNFDREKDAAAPISATHNIPALNRCVWCEKTLPQIVRVHRVRTRVSTAACFSGQQLNHRGDRSTYDKKKLNNNLNVYVCKWLLCVRRYHEMVIVSFSSSVSRRSPSIVCMHDHRPIWNLGPSRSSMQREGFRWQRLKLLLSGRRRPPPPPPVARRKRVRGVDPNREAREGARATRAKVKEEANRNRGGNRQPERGGKKRPEKVAAPQQKGGRAQTRRWQRNLHRPTKNGLRVPPRRGELSKGAKRKDNLHDC